MNVNNISQSETDKLLVRFRHNEINSRKREKILEKGIDIGTDIAEDLKGLFKPKDKK